jgi:membrane fusion protein, multidrug efflux system
MTEETKSTSTHEAQGSNPDSNGNRADGNHQPAAETEQRHGLSEQARRDEEIEEIQKRSKHQPVTVQSAPEQPPASPRKALMVVAILLVLLLLAGGVTMLTRLNHDRVLAKETERETVPTVAVVKPLAEKPDEDLVLPGSLLAFEESPIYARTNGYLVKWYKDIGSKVKKGDLLAKIDTPEVDQELNQARATRQQVLAQLDLAKISSDRWEALRKTDSVSAQEADQQTSGYKQAQANLLAADANVRRLEQLEGFKDVFAPFDGVLTRRNVDPGALINAGAGATGRELFDLARVDPLRVYTSVPQAYSPFIKVGAKSTVTLQEFPGEKFLATIARTAESIDTNTRTLLTEVDVPNKNGRLLPGSFGEVHFAVGNNVNKVTVPVNAMLFRAQGAQVAVVGSDSKIQLRPITIGRDYGTTLEILGGVTPDDQIVINPPDSLENGEQVSLAQASASQQQTTPAAPPQSENQPVQQDQSQQGSGNSQKGKSK